MELQNNGDDELSLFEQNFYASHIYRGVAQIERLTENYVHYQSWHDGISAGIHAASKTCFRLMFPHRLRLHNIETIQAWIRKCVYINGV